MQVTPTWFPQTKAIWDHSCLPPSHLWEQRQYGGGAHSRGEHFPAPNSKEHWCPASCLLAGAVASALGLIESSRLSLPAPAAHRRSLERTEGGTGGMAEPAGPGRSYCHHFATARRNGPFWTKSWPPAMTCLVYRTTSSHPHNTELPSPP